MIPSLATLGYFAILAVGFGFVVFWHELGHFLSAKWAGVRVEQFAVGFAHAALSWRKGIGLRIGSTQKEYKRRINEYLAAKSPGEKPTADKLTPDVVENPEERWSDRERAEAGDALGLGETEYRLNWLPLGGYVKMVGQDDLRPNAEADDPRAYNRQSIPKRMVIVSAGVIMNVFLAMIGFMVLFTIGFNVPPTYVGMLQAGSPAQLAGVHIGDRIVSLDGKPQYDDWTKVQLNAALAANDQDIPVEVERWMPDGSKKLIALTIKPRKSGTTSSSFVSLGIGPYAELKGIDPAKASEAEFNDKDIATRSSPASLLIRPGESIVAVNGKPVGVHDFATLDAAIQTGKTVTLGVKNTKNEVESRAFEPALDGTFGKEQFDLAGMVPRQQIDSIISKTSPAAGKLNAGDVIVSISRDKSSDAIRSPSFQAFKKLMREAADASDGVKLSVLRKGNAIEVGGLKPIQIRRDDYGLSVALEPDDTDTLVAEVVSGSAADRAGIRGGSRIISVGGTTVKNWRAVHLALREAAAAESKGVKIPVAIQNEAGAKTVELALLETEISDVTNVRYEAHLYLDQTIGVRKGNGIAENFKLGVIETRDFILQFYVTLKRMVTRDISASNLMGPIGIFQTGTSIAAKGTDWLVWFLAMISANLAVVNFLPIPIVDGGLFTFLIIEKIKGRPVSPKVQMIATRVGLVLLMGIFLFVTFQDVMNFPFRMMK